MAFLPISKQDMVKRGYNYLDFIFVTGDAYVDHPSFGTAILSRLLESKGYKVGIIAQPDVSNEKDIMRLGMPRYAFLVNAGVIDSMVAHYTVSKKRRHDDAYTAGNKTGKRPDRAVTVYSNLIKKCYPKSKIIIGGLESSLRRFAHYDYWKDEVMPSVLVDSKADILSYGMGERVTLQLAEALKKHKDFKDIRGICYLSDTLPKNAEVLPSFNEVKTDKLKYAVACREEYDEHDSVYGRILAQKHENAYTAENGESRDLYLIQNPPQEPLSTKELDEVYSLPFERYYHPIYEPLGGVPAIKEVEFSVTHNRGCFGACNFCSIAFHQGREISSRSIESCVKEAQLLTESPHFKGYIHDVGGPTANFRKPSCKKQIKYGLCKGKKCLAPTPCKNLEVTHEEYLELLKKISEIPKIKKVFIRSGIRFDYLILDKNEEFFKELVKNHVSGQLKVAPEHCSPFVLDKMGKPHIEVYNKFAKRFYDITKGINKKQYLVPYLMSSHPGSRLQDAIELTLFLKKNGMHPEQVQDFYPTPGTISTCMYYTELDPTTLEKIYVPKTQKEKAEQRALLQYFKPENKHLVISALKKANRYDLIGFGKNCLVTPEKTENKERKNSSKFNANAGRKKSFTLNNKNNKNKKQRAKTTNRRGKSKNKK